MTDAREHSVKVPQLYKKVARIAQLVREKGGSLKDLVYNVSHPNIKAIYALVVETLQREKELDSIFEKTKILQKEIKLDPWLARVLITEFLWGKKRLSGESKPVKTVLSYQSSFLVGSGGDVDAGKGSKPTNQVHLPRYVRVNTLCMTVEEAVGYFRDEGWLLARKGDGNLFPSDDHFRIDTHIPELLAFPPATTLYNHPLYKNSSILLQDKASCLASYLLAPPSGSTVLDMCAAPGMKATHLAAQMCNKGTLYAVERNPGRYKTLCSLIEEAGATCVKTLLGDAVQLKSEEVPDVEYILVDPSCSGTGMVTRPKVGDSLEGSARLRKLVSFQRLLLLHALTAFPKAIRVVYSTCSLLPDENEGVVEWTLEQVARNHHASGWHLNEDPLPGWSSRGCEKSYPGIGKHCLYAHTETDLTNGFFMATFERSHHDGIGEEITGVGQKKKKEEMWNDDVGTTATPENKKKSRKKQVRQEEMSKEKELNVVGISITENTNKVHMTEEMCNEAATITASAKKKKKRKRETRNEELGEGDDEDVISPAKTEEMKGTEEDGINNEGVTVTEETKKTKRRKQKRRNDEDSKDDDNIVTSTINTGELSNTEMEVNDIEAATVYADFKKKKKKKQERMNKEEDRNDDGVTPITEGNEVNLTELEEVDVDKITAPGVTKKKKRVKGIGGGDDDEAFSITGKTKSRKRSKEVSKENNEVTGKIGKKVIAESRMDDEETSTIIKTMKKKRKRAEDKVKVIKAAITASQTEEKKGSGEEKQSKIEKEEDNFGVAITAEANVKAEDAGDGNVIVKSKKKKRKRKEGEEDGE